MKAKQIVLQLTLCLRFHPQNHSEQIPASVATLVVDVAVVGTQVGILRPPIDVSYEMEGKEFA